MFTCTDQWGSNLLAPVFGQNVQLVDKILINYCKRKNWTNQASLIPQYGDCNRIITQIDAKYCANQVKRGSAGTLYWHNLRLHHDRFVLCDLLFVEVDSVVMHPTSITTTSRMLPVFACGREPVILTRHQRHRDRKTHLVSNSPTRPCPWLTCPRSFLVLVFLVGWERRADMNVHLCRLMLIHAHEPVSTNTMVT